MFGGSTVDAVAAYRRFIIEDPRPEILDAVRPRTIGGAEEPLHGFELREEAALPSLEQVVLDVATEFDIDQKLLASDRRDSKLVYARLEIARRALAAGVASLAAVAARLGRSPSTLSEQLNRR
jgi:hypothetical protein